MKDEIISLLPKEHPWGQNIHWFDTIGSTNTHAKELAAKGAPHGTVLLADRQTGGRGRMGRSFHSPGGVGVYMSVILRLQCHPQQLMHLTCASAVAACHALRQVTGILPGIKWTNDLVWGQRKIAGILTELVLLPGEVCAIIGIGVNCRQSREDFPDEIRDMAASLSMVTGQQISRSAVAAALIQAFFEMDAGLLTGKADMLARYRENCVTLGQDVSLLRSDTVRHAHAVDVDEDGGLVVRFPDGHLETVCSGEVSVRGMYGYLDENS